MQSRTNTQPNGLAWCAILMMVAASSCGPKKTRLPVPVNEDVRNWIEAGDRFLAKNHYYAWSRALSFYELAQSGQSSRELADKIRLARALMALRQRQEMPGALPGAMPEEMSGTMPNTDRDACQQTGSRPLQDLCRMLSDPPSDTLQASPTVRDYLALLRLERSDSEDFGQSLSIYLENDPLNPLFLYHAFPSDPWKLAELADQLPDFVELRVSAGEGFFHRQKPGQAIDWFSRALKLVDGYPRALQGLAEVHNYLLRDYPSALEAYEKVLAQHPSAPMSLFGKAICLHFGENYALSNHVFERLVKILDGLSPDSMDQDRVRYLRDQAAYYQSFNHHLAGNGVKARHFLRQAKERMPRSTKVSYLGGLMAYEDGQLDQAKKEFTIAAKDNCRASYYLGAIAAQRQNERALSQFSLAAYCMLMNLESMRKDAESVSGLDLPPAHKDSIRRSRLREIRRYSADSSDLVQRMLEHSENFQGKRVDAFRTLLGELILELKAGGAK